MRAILTYHSIDDSGSPISVRPDAFSRHVRWLASGTVTVTTVEELVKLPPSADAVAITFDDGFRNFEEHAQALLDRHMPVTVFVVSDRVGKTNAWDDRPSSRIPVLPLLDWPALARLRDRGVVLGAHSRTHADLTRMTPSELEDEVLGSADVIAREAGARPTLFAYPYGRVNSLVAAVVGSAYPFGCTTAFLPLSDDCAAERLPRLDMYYMQRRGRIEQWGTPAFQRFITLRHQLRRVRQAVTNVGRRQMRMLSLDSDG
jgi:peptidoglycan/xylan/chitin deacetylase (PgdA/CDA1 family)